MNRRRRPPPKRRHWPSDDDIRTYALMSVIVFSILNAVASCALGPVTDGEPDIYEPLGLGSIVPGARAQSRVQADPDTSLEAES